MKMPSEAENRVSDGIDISGSYPLRIEYAGKQNIVFQMNVVVQIVRHFFRQRVKPRPASAGSFGRLEIVGQLFEPFNGAVMFFVFVHHHADGHRRTASNTLINHRKQHPFLFHHMHQQFVLHIGKQPGNFRRKGIGMDLGHFLRQRHQFFKLCAVDIVVALQDMIDSRTKGSSFPTKKSVIAVFLL